MSKLRRIIGWLCVPYIMIFLRWKRINRIKRFWGTAWAAWAVMSVIIVIAVGATAPPTPVPPATPAPSKTVTASKPVTAAPKPSVKPVQHVPHVSPSPSTVISNAIHSALNGQVDNKPQLESVEVNAYAGDDAAEKGKYIVIVRMLANDGFSTDGAMQATVDAVKRASHTLFGSSSAVYEVDYLVDTQLKDQYGRVINGQWCRMTLMGSDGYKINYDNVDDQEFAKLMQFNAVTNDARDAWSKLVSG